MAANYCKSCGKPLSPENNFCPNCGKPLDAAPTITQKSYKSPQGAEPPLTPSSRPAGAFWLGIIGGILGLFIGIVSLTISFILGQALGVQMWEMWLRYIGLIVFSIIGIVGALRIVDNRDTINAGLMILAGVGALICAYLSGLLSALLFFVGAVLILLKKG